MRETANVHPDTYATRLGAFCTYDGITMPQWCEWSDATTPRTDRPVCFRPFMGRSATFYAGSIARFITR